MDRIFMPLTLNDAAELDAWRDHASEGRYFAEADSHAWILYSNEEGDWFAVRPPSEDDSPLVVDGVVERLSDLEFPITVYLPVSAPRVSLPRCEACGAGGDLLLPDESGGWVHPSCDDGDDA